MTTVCFVVPQDEFQRLFLQQPIDVLNAAAVLEADGLDVRLWDRRLTAVPPLQTTPDLAVLVTAVADRAQCYPLDIAPSREAVRELRSLWPATPVIAVGPHGTHLPDVTLRDLGVDHVARGENDSAAVRAVRDFVAGRALTPVLPMAGTYEDLDTDHWPLPAYHLTDSGDYTAEVVLQGRAHRGPAGLVLGVRGCSYGCTFCHLPFGTRMRPRAVSRTMREITRLRDLGTHSLFFLDYVFGLHPTYYDDLCREMTGLGIGWTGQTRAEVVLRSDVTRWAEAGCTGMWLGAESPGVADAGVGKRVSVEKVTAAIEKLADAGITPLAFILLGLPDDPACQRDRLVDWAAGLPALFGLNQLVLRPGTRLYDDLAPRYTDGSAPAHWTQVEDVTRRYRSAYPADLDDQWERLMSLPNYLGNAMAAG
ncbi:B12-binding domain-containing radical SAM protein [Streptomyces olivaceoviridis]|uniref:B12-binding domain-containing radical SAM protein n=1 Tax=Streptomyces olivaceoviridis TaxID=1921 RepID=UPI0036D12E57